MHFKEFFGGVMPRIGEFDDFETALRKLVGKNEKSETILRQAVAVLAAYVNPDTYVTNELTLLRAADDLDLTPQGVQKVHNKLGQGEIIRTMALLMAAARSTESAQITKDALVVKSDTEEFKKMVPGIYREMEQFIRPEFLDAFRYATSDPAPAAKNPPVPGLDTLSGGGS